MLRRISLSGAHRNPPGRHRTRFGAAAPVGEDPTLVNGSVLPADRAPERIRNLVAALLGALLALGGLVAVPPDAGAATGLPPSGTIQNIPDNGTCGDNGGRWVKFTTGGPVGSSGSANSGNPKWDATYTTTAGTFQLTAVTDEFGNPIWFEQIAGGAEKDNPLWMFPVTDVSPVLAVPNVGNFSQFAICALPAITQATITKTVQGADVPADLQFSISIDCRLGEGADNLADPATPTLVNGQTGTISAPAGSSCQVSEPVLPTGYELVSITPSSFTMPTPTKNNPHPTVAISVVNKVSDAPLTIAKTSIGGVGTFTFNVTCTGPTGIVVFQQDGVQVTTTATETPTSIGLTVPANATCTVLEVDLPAGFTSDQPDGGVVVSAGGTAAFSNTGRGSLQVTKTQVGGPAGQTFTIHYECTDGTTGDLTLGDGQSQMVDGILGGSTCTVTESADQYEISITPSTTGIGPGETSEVAVLNTRKTMTFALSKMSIGGVGTFTFDVDCSNDAGETFTDTVTIDTSEAGSFTTSTPVGPVPTGLTCTVTEQVPDGWQVDVASDTFVVGSGDPLPSFVNTKWGALSIVKEQAGGPAGTTFTVHYDCGTAGSGDVSVVGNGDPVSIPMPAGTTCTVTESADGYSTEISDGGVAVIPAGAAATVTVRNTRETTDLTIVKGAVGGAGTFTFDVSCTNDDGTETWSANDIEITVGLDASTSTTVDGIPTGLTCTVTEDTATGWTPTVTSQVVTAGGEVSFTNTRDTTYLRINKKAIGGTGEFTFAVTCTSPTDPTFTATATVRVTTAGGSGSTTVSGIPTGMSCTVTETGQTGWVVDHETQTATAGGSVSFVNTRQTGSLEVTKINDGGPATQPFTITYTCSDGTTGSFVLVGGQSATRSGIASGSTCTVTETATGYSTTIDPAAPVTIPADGTASVTVKNTRQRTSLVITKAAVNGTGSVTFTFDVVCTGAYGETWSTPPAGVSITVTYANPEGNTTVTGTTTLTGIPTGLTCTVTERGQDLWKLTAPSPAADGTGAVRVTAGGTVKFTNTWTPNWYGRTPGYWKNHSTSWPKFSITSGTTTIQVTTATRVRTVFAVPSSFTCIGSSDTLLKALSYKGGSTTCQAAQILLRAATAALLNEAYFGSGYPTYDSTQQLINAVDAALATKDRATIIALATKLDYWNNGIH